MTKFLLGLGTILVGCGDGARHALRSSRSES